MINYLKSLPNATAQPGPGMNTMSHTVVYNTVCMYNRIIHCTTLCLNVAPQISPGPLSGRKRPLAGDSTRNSPAKKTKSQTGIHSYK